MNKKQPSLIFCIIMDLIGCASYVIPGMGEWTDVAWAPVSGIIFFFTFGMGWRSAIGGLFNFTEEILPFTDIIPTFTIAWIWRYLVNHKTVANTLYR